MTIGFVNSLQVLYGTERGKQDIAKVEQFIAEQQQQYDSRRLELERQKEQFETQQRTLNPQTRVEMQRKIEEDDRALRRFQEDTQVEINRRREEILGTMSQQIQVIINDYAREQKLGMIFLRNESQLYVDPSLDLTQEIIRIYNERYPGNPSESSVSSSSPAQP